MSVDESNILNLTNLGNNADDDVVAEPGTPENPWIGFERVIRGQKTFHAFSGAQRRTLRRQQERDRVNEQQRGQRAYNRQQRKREFDAGTVRQQLAILKGEIPVSPAMMANLVGHIQRQTSLAERDAEKDPAQRRAEKEQRRDARLQARQYGRVAVNKGRHSDLVAMGMRDA